MQRDRRVGGVSDSKAEIGSLERKRINDALHNHHEKSSTVIYRVFNGIDAEHLTVPSASFEKQSGYFPVASSKNKFPDGEQETVCAESDASGSDVDEIPWISWFCSLKGNEFFCEVDGEYIKDDFNLCGLNSQVPYYDYTLDLILDVETSHGDTLTDEQNELIESAAEMLYGLIHARYILTSKGMSAMLNKFKSYAFGRCPRVYCCGQPCLPVGQSDISRSSAVKIYCPKCEDAYYPRSRHQGNIDGAYFGTTFPHLFMMTYPHLRPQKGSQRYTPRIFGFKINNKPSLRASPQRL